MFVGWWVGELTAWDLLLKNETLETFISWTSICKIKITETGNDMFDNIFYLMWNDPTA
jgi:hypothetical protein